LLVLLDSECSKKGEGHATRIPEALDTLSRRRLAESGR
jgi:hypothetical protein